MLEPKKTSVALAGQKASHSRAREEMPRFGGKCFRRSCAHKNQVLV
jgi:hypothetical protein